MKQEKTKQEKKKLYKTHKKRIVENYEKFQSGKWNVFQYAFDFNCDENTVRIILNQIMMEKINALRWEKNTFGLKLPKYSLIEIPESIEIHPHRIIEHENHVELIYKSKIQ